MRKEGRILIVEDYEDTVAILKRLLEKEKFEVETALTGAEAMQKVASFRPEVIVLDISLPDVDGLDLIPRFKEEDPEVEIIVLTAYAELENAVRSVREGASDFISKPFDSRYLLHSIRRCLEMRHLRERLLRSEKLRALGEMAAGVAHDFNNVLSALQVQLTVLRMKANGGLERHELEKYLDNLERIARDGQAIVERLRKFYRREETKREPVSLRELVEDVVKMTEPKWRHEPLKRGAKIKISTNHQGEITVMANASDLREVLTNLIFNAVEAMPQGGEIRIETYRDGNFGVIEIGDTGHGIPAEMREQIFEPFFTTKDQGTGLGLAICYRLIQNLGGDIEVESTPGQGTTFYLRLPLAA